MDKFQFDSEIKNSVELTELSILLSDVVHALQLERGSSSLFLTKQQFRDDLHKYQAETDIKVISLHKFLANSNLSDAYFKVELSKILKTLKNLNSIRSNVSNLTISQSKVIKQYTEINKLIFDFVIHTTRVSSYKDVFPLKMAYINFLRIKEEAGRERALLVTISAQKTIEPQQLKQLNELITIQKAYLKHDAMQYLTVQQLDLLTSKLASSQIKEANKIRDLVVNSTILPDDIDSKQWFIIQTGKIEILKQIGDTIADDLYTKAETKYIDNRNKLFYFILAIILNLSLVIVFFIIILKNTTTRLNKAVQLANSIADKNLNNKITTVHSDEIGQLLQAFDRMQTQLRERIQQNKLITEKAIRINQALDRATTNILITDNDYNIIYLNKAAQHLFSKYESVIRSQIPTFDAKQILGSNFSSYHQNNYAHKQQVLENIQTTHNTKIVIGDITLDHVITLVTDGEENLGIIVEFADRTVEVAIEKEINTVIQAASVGDFKPRISLTNKEGFVKIFANSINDIMDINQSVIEDLMHLISALAEGDLTQKIEHDYVGAFDQLKNDMNTTVTKLTEIITAMLQTAKMVNGVAERISKSNLSLSKRTEAQASSLEETAASIQQITATMQQNANHTIMASELAEKAKERAKNGGQVINSTIQSMVEINKSSKKISDIIGVIDEIAFQTNLLSLNAAVEAAHAGEQGRGFAVVATEVRNLAQRSAKAAKEIKTLIRDSAIKVEEGTRLVNQSGETLHKIVSSSEKVSDIISDIAAATKEQSSGIHQINMSIAQMDDMTQQNAALAGEASSTGNLMKEQAHKLEGQVAFFYVGKPSEKIVEDTEMQIIPEPYIPQNTKNSNGWEDF
ncbi:MAG: nitrate- and nitrite sensing domain-containing protein [Candidatus Marithrix sp.]|nr:nitrate- and nitrite sensing domain-containing protein [Candidatus Marithrix sp.]